MGEMVLIFFYGEKTSESYKRCLHSSEAFLRLTRGVLKSKKVENYNPEACYT